MTDLKNPLPLGNAPDWGRSQVNSATKTAPVGNPTMWGNQLLFPIEADTTVHRYQTAQIIQTAVRDSYARPWTLAGTLSMPLGMSGLPDAAGFLALGLDTWACFLNVVMGVGQTHIIHNINLRALIAIQAPFYATFNEMQFTGSLPTPTSPEIVPFVIGADALIGNTIQAQLIVVERLSAPPLPALFQFGVSLIATPFAAGTEL